MREEDKTEKKVSFLQFLNTAILTIIGIFAGAILISMNSMDTKISSIQAVQAVQASEIIRLDTNQKIVITNQGNFHTRVFDLEVNRAEQMKQYMETNFIRKPQK